MASRLRLHIDKFINESDVVKPAYKVVKLLKDKGLAVIVGKKNGENGKFDVLR
jgi:hypothetical protein